MHSVVAADSKRINHVPKKEVGNVPTSFTICAHVTGGFSRLTPDERVIGACTEDEVTHARLVVLATLPLEVWLDTKVRPCYSLHR